MKTLILLTFFLSCSNTNEEKENYLTPKDLNDGWSVSSLQEENIDADIIDEVINLIETDLSYKSVHSMVIAANGKLVFEKIFSDRYRDEFGDEATILTRHTLQSVTKSFASTIIGILIDEGKISSVNEPIKSLLPDSYNIDWSGGKDKITLKHVLTMSAGLSGDDSESKMASNYSEYFYSNTLEYTPGDFWEYRTALSNTLRDIIAHAIQSDDVAPYLKKVLFEPLNIDKLEWKYRNENKHVQLGGGLFLSPRSTIKLGQLFLDSGVWNGKRILSEKWIREATSMQFNSQYLGFIHDVYKIDGYGYKWWINNFIVDGKTINAYQASGYGGQYIVVIPKLKVVVNFTCATDNDNIVGPLNLIEDYILKAFKVVEKR